VVGAVQHEIRKDVEDPGTDQRKVVGIRCPELKHLMGREEEEEDRQEGLEWRNLIAREKCKSGRWGGKIGEE
jgi:hypothetical protein